MESREIAANCLVKEKDDISWISSGQQVDNCGKAGPRQVFGPSKR